MLNAYTVMAFTPKFRLHCRASKSCNSVHAFPLDMRITHADGTADGRPAYLEVPLLVTVYAFQALLCRKPSVAVHDERDMLRYWPMSQHSDDAFPDCFTDPGA